MKFYFALSLLCIAATSSASPSRSSLQQPCSKCLQQEGCPYICQHVCEDLSSTACVSCIGSYCPASMTTCRHFCPPTRSHSEEEAEDPRPVGSSLVEDLAALLDPRPSPKDACSDCLSKSGDQGCIACEGVCRSDPNVECKRCVFDLCEKCFHACNPPDSDRSGSDRDSSGKRRQGLPMGERPRDEAGHHEPLSSSQQLDTCLKCVMLHGCSECRMPCLYPYSRECSSCVSIQCPVCSDNCRPPQLGVSRGREVGAPQQPLGPPMVERLDIRDHPSYAESGPPGSPGDLREVPMEDTLRHAGCKLLKSIPPTDTTMQTLRTHSPTCRLYNKDIHSKETSIARTLLVVLFLNKLTSIIRNKEINSARIISGHSFLVFFRLPVHPWSRHAVLVDLHGAVRQQATPF